MFFKTPADAPRLRILMPGAQRAVRGCKLRASLKPSQPEISRHPASAR
jgi:hypothetical protein